MPGQYPELGKVAEDIDAAMAGGMLTRPIEVYRGLDLYGLIGAAPGQWRGRGFHDPAPAQVSTDRAAAARHGGRRDRPARRRRDPARRPRGGITQGREQLQARE
ncbi:hypothetical protein [Dactylosporangium sp. CA-092794]|uniref:hypothetical protein n=1 Tax=Dactylosporangium sp. CA-092794 TaxID=3239929 RepID=UPI003D8FAF23